MSTTSLTLRALLEPEQISGMQEEIILDVEVPGGYDDRRLAAIQRGLVAHGALLQLLKRVDFPPPLPTKLIDAIKAAKELGLIGEPGRRWLTWINYKANRGKHDLDFPF